MAKIPISGGVELGPYNEGMKKDMQKGGKESVLYLDLINPENLKDNQQLSEHMIPLWRAVNFTLRFK